jgi:hypothetical protein
MQQKAWKQGHSWTVWRGGVGEGEGRECPNVPFILHPRIPITAHLELSQLSQGWEEKVKAHMHTQAQGCDHTT